MEVIRERKKNRNNGGSYMHSGAKPERYHRLREVFVSSIHQSTYMASEDARVRGKISRFV